MSAGKGDTPRPVNPTVYGQNYDDIFRKESPQPEQPEQTEHETESKKDP